MSEDYRLGTTDPYPLERSIAHKLRCASREVMRGLEQRLIAHQIPPGIWFFMRVLWDAGSIGQSELAERAGLMAPTTVAAMTRMERLGLITRKRLPEDRRRFDVHLTARGRELRKALMPEAIAVVNVALEGLSRRDVERLHRYLDTIVANLQRDDAERARDVRPPPRVVRRVSASPRRR